VGYVLKRLTERSETSVGVRTLVRKAGHERTSAKLLKALQSSLSDAGIHHWPRDLTECRESDGVRYDYRLLLELQPAASTEDD